jgi:Mis12 protein
MHILCLSFFESDAPWIRLIFQQIAKNKGYKSISEQKINEVRKLRAICRFIYTSNNRTTCFIFRPIVLQCCEKLQARMIGHYDKNMKKFGQYADRNIFVLPQPAQSSRASTADTEAAIKAEMEAMTAEIHELRSKYASLKEAHSVLSRECRDADLLLKDMRNALFNLRVGAQALETNQVQPLAETVAIMEQHKQALMQLSWRALELNNQMKQHAHLDNSKAIGHGAAGASSSASAAIGDANIAFTSAEDAALLTKNIQASKH